MVTTESKRIANRAASAKRTASSLRSLAEATDLDAADRGLLLTAARVVDKIAGEKSKEAKAKKAAEEKFERARKAAMPEATKLVAALPQTTTIDRIALVYMNSYRCTYLEQCLNAKDSPEHLQRILKMDVEDAIREEAADLSYKAAKEGKPVSCYQPELVGRFNRAHEKHEVARLATRFDAATAAATANA